METSSIVSLRAAIVGAGIGGLTAAIALRREGHQVDVSCSLCLARWRAEAGLLRQKIYADI
jgi:glycine/D-amino acid oxidase-like deaminating enzyme